MNKLEIYVAGVHSKTKQIELLHFFESFGPIVSVEPRPCKDDKGFHIKSNPWTSRVYWIVRAGDYETYKNILDSKSIMFFGRTLYMSPVMTGRDLILHSKLKSKKRVLIKKVPSWVTEEQLLSAIESQIGKVEAYFKYETDSHKAKKHDSKKKIRKVCTYSVTMQEKHCRDQLIGLGWLKITPEISVPVEKYISLRMDGSSHLQQSSPLPADLDTRYREYQSLQVFIPQAKKRNDRNSFSQSTGFVASPALEKPELLDDCHLAGDRHIVLTMPEHLKPTQKRYHCFHRDHYSTIKPALEEDSNLRFNAVAGSHRFL